MIRARYVPAADPEQILDPDAAAWKSVRPARLQLMGTPIGLQPTAAIRASWAAKKIGVVERVEVAAVHDGKSLAFHLSWQDASEDREIDDTTSFPDAAAVLLPSVAGAPSVTMGAPTLPVNGWFWHADAEGLGRHVVAEGIGTTRDVDHELVRGRGVWKEGRWRVVITRALRIETSEPVAQLQPGDKTGLAVAVWDGSHRERGGIKAFSGDWQELVLDPMPTARR